MSKQWGSSARSEDKGRKPAGLMTFRNEAEMLRFARKYGRSVDSVKREAKRTGVRLFK